MTGRNASVTDDAQTDDRVDRIVDDLSTDEKIDLVHGGVDPAGRATGYVPANDRAGTPPLSLVDGPMGIRAVTATAFPASIALAASWDPDLARDLGRGLGLEARGAGQDALLAPGFNIVRVPQCGRAFEYYSEDPHLTSRLAVGTVEGVQSAGVMATAKHFVANNQEADRHHVSADVSERALREIYLPAFEAAVRETDVASVMAAYNRINGTYAPQHRRLLTDVLKDEWEFEGFVVSDWWATHDGPAAATAGLDLDMPGMPVYEWQEHGDPLFAVVEKLSDGSFKDWLARVADRRWQPENPNPNVLMDSPFDEPLREAIASGELDEALLDEKVRRILGQMARFGLLDDVDDRPAGAIDDPDHRELARRVAERGTVMLTNDGALPLDPDADLALVGPHADEPKVGGGGSSEVDAVRTTAPPEGIRARLEGGALTVERGHPRVGDAGMHDSLVPDLDEVWPDDDPRIEEAMRAARRADVAVVVVRDLASEGADRALDLPGAQDELITAVAAEADRTVVVLNTAGAVEMPWLEAVDAVLQTWYPGQADGEALASVLFGDADPSGRLPVTFADPEDYPATTEREYPGVDGEVHYEEGVFVGYRHFDAEDRDPLFPFGHGLSYTDFEYGDLTVEVLDGDGGGENDDGDDADEDANAGTDDERPRATVEVTVENVGDRAGRDVVQVYLSDVEATVDRPPRELVAFEPVHLGAGETTTVSLELDRRAFAYYDEDWADWTVEPGEFEVLVGRSSRDMRVRESVDVDV